MKKRLLIVVGAMAFGMYSLSAIATPNPLKYWGFERMAAEIRDLTLGYCQRKGGGVLNGNGIIGPLNDANNFRQACGQGVHEMRINSTDWHLHYWREENRNAQRDILGVQRLIEVNGESYSLVMGWEWRRQQPAELPEITSENAIAALFQYDGNTWQPAWYYSDPAKRDWMDPWDLSEEPTWTKLTISDLQNIWMKYVVRDYESLLFDIKDSRGTGFP